MCFHTHALLTDYLILLFVVGILYIKYCVWEDKRVWSMNDLGTFLKLPGNELAGTRVFFLSHQGVLCKRLIFPKV